MDGAPRALLRASKQTGTICAPVRLISLFLYQTTALLDFSPDYPPVLAARSNRKVGSRYLDIGVTHMSTHVSAVCTNSYCVVSGASPQRPQADRNPQKSQNQDY